MLHPNTNRLDYGDLLMPPEGFQLENAIATSYSLDLDTFISIPVALYLSHSLEVNLKNDFVKVLDSIRRASDTVRIFCQKGQIKVPDRQNRLYSFIEPCVVQIPPSHQHSFHPKVWIIRYKNSYNEFKYRVIILSRNLTFDRSWDVAFSLDGNVPKKKSSPKILENQPLISFISYLTKHDTTPWYKSFVQDLWKTEFDLSLSPFESFEFVPMGIGNNPVTFFDEGKQEELFVISPFITKGGLEAVKKYSSTKPTLISREEELRKIDADTLRKFDIWHLDPDFVQGEMKNEADTQENSHIQFQDMHAKVYCYKTGWNACLILGSANCSDRAMHKNVEFMIKLKGKNSKVGPGVLKKELLDNNLNYFIEFEHATIAEEQKDLQHELDQILQRARVDLANAELTASAIIQEDNNYQIDFSYDLRDLSVNRMEEVQARCYLINNEDQSTSLKFGMRNDWSIKNLNELDVSSFLVFELSIANSTTTCRFAIKVKIDNLPETRNTRIFRDIISNTANFFIYLRFLLVDNSQYEMNSLEDPANGLEDEAKNKWLNKFALEEAIYENMLKAASREPHKLLEIKELIERLSQEEEAITPIIPDDFKALWQVFEKSRRN